MHAEKLIKDYNAHLAQQTKLEGYPSWIEREQAAAERKQAALAKCQDPAQAESLKKEIAAKQSLIERLQRDLEQAHGANSGSALQQKIARLALIDPHLDLTKA